MDKIGIAGNHPRRRHAGAPRSNRRRLYRHLFLL